MKALILFTKSATVGSAVIRAVTGEPVSHCAVYVPELDAVWHSTVPVSKKQSYECFLKTNIVVYSVETEVTQNQVLLMDGLMGKSYDYIKIVYLGIKILLKKINISIHKADLTYLSGLYLCTEFVSDVVLNDENTNLTPYKLYLTLLRSK